MKSTAIAHNNPGKPATKNACLHPYERAIVPLRAKLKATATGNPIRKMESAFDRRSDGTESPIKEVAAGAHDASPTPTRRRTTKSWRKFWASPEPTVIKLQTRTPA